MEVTLVMYKADGARRDFPLCKARVLIGRDNACELRVPLPSVSRKHCELKVASGSVKLRDLGSSNGTFINGNKVKAETPLSPGDRIQVGAVIFTVIIDGVPASLEPSDTLMAAQAQAERDHGAAGPAEAKARKSRQDASSRKDDVKPATPSKAASAASDELDALLSSIGDDLLDRSDVGSLEDSSAEVELLSDSGDEQSSAELDEQLGAKGQADESSELDGLMSGIEDQFAGSEVLPELDDSDELDAPPAQPAPPTKAPPPPGPEASKPPAKKKKKKKSKSDPEDPISALEAMADGSDDSDIDLSWLDDDAT
jgi:hypothetical protein